MFACYIRRQCLKETKRYFSCAKLVLLAREASNGHYYLHDEDDFFNDLGSISRFCCNEVMWREQVPIGRSPHVVFALVWKQHHAVTSQISKTTISKAYEFPFLL